MGRSQVHAQSSILALQWRESSCGARVLAKSGVESIVCQTIIRVPCQTQPYKSPLFFLSSTLPSHPFSTHPSQSFSIQQSLDHCSSNHPRSFVVERTSTIRRANCNSTSLVPSCPEQLLPTRWLSNRNVSHSSLMFLSIRQPFACRIYVFESRCSSISPLGFPLFDPSALLSLCADYVCFFSPEMLFPKSQQQTGHGSRHALTSSITECSRAKTSIP
jgi:hypothetical protein